MAHVLGRGKVDSGVRERLADLDAERAHEIEVIITADAEAFNGAMSRLGAVSDEAARGMAEVGKRLADAFPVVPIGSPAIRQLYQTMEEKVRRDAKAPEPRG
jgi:hypothetical protein